MLRQLPYAAKFALRLVAGTEDMCAVKVPLPAAGGGAAVTITFGDLCPVTLGQYPIVTPVRATLKIEIIYR